MHIDDHIGGVRQFDADFGNIGPHRPHGERNHIQNPSLHAAVIQTEHGLLQLFVDFLGKSRLHHRVIEHITSKNLSYINIV